jgi:hypothetical protein
VQHVKPFIIIREKSFKHQINPPAIYNKFSKILLIGTFISSPKVCELMCVIFICSFRISLMPSSILSISSCE